MNFKLNSQLNTINIMKKCLRIQLLMALSLLLIPLSGFSQKADSNGETPAPFPRLISTGNSEVDKTNYEEAVRAWKETERQRVIRERKASDASNLSNASNPSQASKAKMQKSETPLNDYGKGMKNVREITIIDLPSYPKYISTGNPKLDDLNYQKEKTKWIEENPTLYKDYLNSHSKTSSNEKKERLRGSAK